MADEEKRPALLTEAGVGNLLQTVSSLPKLPVQSAATEESLSPDGADGPVQPADAPDAAVPVEAPLAGAPAAAAEEAQLQQADPAGAPVFGDDTVPVEAPPADADAVAEEEAGSPEAPPQLVNPDDSRTDQLTDDFLGEHINAVLELVPQSPPELILMGIDYALDHGIEIEISAVRYALRRIPEVRDEADEERAQQWDEVLDSLQDVIRRGARPSDEEPEDPPRAGPPRPTAPPVFGGSPPQSPRPQTHVPHHRPPHAAAAGAGGGGGIPRGDAGKDEYLDELEKTVKASMASYSTKKVLVARIREIATHPAKIATLGRPLPVDIAAITVEITANMNESPPPERAVFFTHYWNYLKNLVPIHLDCDLLSDERDSIRGVDAFAEAFVRGVLFLWYSPDAFKNTVAFIKDRTRRTASYNAAIDQRDRAAAIEWRIHEPMRATSQRAMTPRTPGMIRERDKLRLEADKYLRQLQVHTVATTPVPSTAALIEALRSAAYAAYDPAPVPAHAMTFDVFRRPLLPQVVIGGNIALQDTLQGHARSDNELLEARKAAYRAHVDNVLGSARICTALENARERYLKATKSQRTERVAPDAVPEAERANVAAELKSDGRGDVNRQSATRYSAQIALVERKFRDELHAWATTTRFPELFTGSSFIAGSEVASLKGPAWLGKHPKAP